MHLTNSIARSGGQQFDPYPYIALNLTLSAMAGQQAPVIMTSEPGLRP